MEPGGGAPGRVVRSGTMANRFAAYQVASGGTNCLRPSAIGMATNSAKVGRLMRTTMMPKSKISGPLARCRVRTTLLMLWLPVSLLSVLRWAFAVPACHRSGHLDDGGYPFALGAGPDEHIGRLWLGAV